jgi:ABC-type Na+ efflux pump permease subunit
LNNYYLPSKEKEQWLELSTHKIKKRLLMMMMMMMMMMFFSLFIIVGNAINFTDTII